jgi:hypothetical protein
MFGLFAYLFVMGGLLPDTTADPAVDPAGDTVAGPAVEPAG